MLEIAQLPRVTFYYHIKKMHKADKYADGKTEIAAIHHENKGAVRTMGLSSGL